MNEVTFHLYEHCWQCGGDVELDMPGDAYCFSCGAEAHYGYYYPDPDEKPHAAKPWTPRWLIHEVERLTVELAAAPKVRELVPGTPEWKEFAEKHRGQPPPWKELTGE